MRYVLYETGGKNQCLKKEIGFIKNYLDLEKIRYNANLELSFRVTGDPKGKKIAPLLLVQFIENAFKHGASMSLGKVRIDIDIRIEEESLYFSIGNTKPRNQIGR